MYATGLAGDYPAAVPVAALVDDRAAAKAAGVVARAVEPVQRSQAVEAVGVVVPAAV